MVETAALHGRPHNSSILPLFSLLTSHDVPTRLDASVALLNALPVDGSEKQQSSAEPDADRTYAIKRLLNGLGSTNDAARQGFAVALTELLARLPVEQAESVLPMLLQTTNVTNSTEGKEERALYFGRLLGLHALVRSGVVFRKGTDGESFKEVIQNLIALSNKKSWLKESAYWTIVQSIKSLSATAPSWHNEVQAWVVQRLLNDPRERSRPLDSDKLAVVLALQKCNVNADYAAILAPTFKTGDVLSKKSLSALGTVLKGVSSDHVSENGGPAVGVNAIKTSKGSAAILTANPHFVWSEIFDIYFSDNAGASLSNRASWPDFWRIAVDQPFFGAISHALKATGLALLAQSIQRLPAEDVPSLFSENVMRVLTNNLRKTGEHEKMLSKMVEKLVSSLPGRLASTPSAVFPVLRVLVGPPFGTPTFDAKTLDRLVGKLDSAGIKSWISYLQQVVLTGSLGDDDETIEGESATKILNSRRTWALDQLLQVARANTVTKTDEILAGVLEFFAVVGWFDVRKAGKGARSYAANPSLSPSTREGARTRFYSICNAYFALDTTWLERAVALLDNLTDDKKHFALVEPEEESTYAERKQLGLLAKKISTSKDQKDEHTKALRCLVDGLILLAYEEDPDILPNLELAQDVIKVLYPSVAPKKNGHVAHEDSDDDGEPIEPLSLLMDLLLELLRRPSAFVKTFCLHTFSAHVDALGVQSIDLLIQQIRPEQAYQLEQRQDEDVEMQDANGAAEGVDSEDSSDGSDVDDDDEASEGDVDVDEEFKNELLAALQESGVAYNGADEEETAEDESDEEEEEMLDDDQMLALDDKLAEIFRQQNSSNGKSKRIDRMDDLHYRLRLLDLVELLEKTPTSPLLLQVVVPLIEIVRFEPESAKELQDKAAKLCRNLTTQKKKKAWPAPESTKMALKALATLHSVANVSAGLMLTQLLSATGVYLVKAIVSSPAFKAQDGQQAATLYAEALESYLTQKNSKTKAQPAVTLELCKRQASVAWPLFERLVNLLSADRKAGYSKIVNAYRRIQAFEVAEQLLVSYSALKSDESKRGTSAALPGWVALVHSSLSEAIADPKLLDQNRLKALARMATSTARATRSSNDKAGIAAWGAHDFGSLVEAASEGRYRDSNGVKNVLKGLARVANGAAKGHPQGGKPNGSSPGKRARDEDDEVAALKKTKKDKTKSKSKKN